MSESTTTEEKNVKKEMNFPDLIKELARLDEYCADSRNIWPVRLFLGHLSIPST